MQPLPMARVVAASFFLLVASAAARAADTPRRPAPDTSWDAVRCGALTVRHGRVIGSAGHARVSDWQVVLARPGGRPGGRLRADALATDGPAALDALAPLFAGGLLVGMETDRPPACDLTHSFRQAAAELAALGPGAEASETWTGIDAASGRTIATAASIHLEATHTAGGTARLAAITRGLSTAGDEQAAEPVRMSSVTVSMPYAEARRLADGGTLGPDDVVTIDHATIVTETGHVEASGRYAPDTRTGSLHVTADNFDDLKDALPPTQRTEAGAAFLLLRLAAKHDPDGSLSWDVLLDDDHMTINGVPLPLL